MQVFKVAPKAEKKNPKTESEDKKLNRCALGFENTYTYESNYDNRWLQKTEKICKRENKRRFGNEDFKLSIFLVQLHFILNVILYYSLHSCCFLKQKRLSYY